MNEITRADRLSLVLDMAVRLGVVFGLLFWSIAILRPFILPVIWGTILAVACFPGYEILLAKLGGRRRTAAGCICLLLLATVIVPTVLLGDSLVTGISAATRSWENAGFEIPPPTDQVKRWPLVGERAYESWLLASRNLEAFLRPIAPQLKNVGAGLISGLAGVGFALLQFVFSIAIAGVLLTSSDKSRLTAAALAKRLAQERGSELLCDAAVTIRNVARGIIGVAVIQAFLAGVGFIAAEVPGAGLWALVCLLLGIIQVGVGPVLLLANIYLFSTASPLTAGLFLIWTIIVAPLDNVLKPVLLSKGAPVPTLVIFLGALGGFLQTGLIGLFVGAVVLSVAYKLFLLWLETVDQQTVHAGSLAK